MKELEKAKAIAQVLKSRFSNLTAVETIDLAMKILAAIDKIDDEAPRPLKDE